MDAAEDFNTKLDEFFERLQEEYQELVLEDFKEGHYSLDSKPIYTQPREFLFRMSLLYGDDIYEN